MNRKTDLPDDSKAILAELLGPGPRWLFTLLTLGISVVALAVVFDETVARIAGEFLPFKLGRGGVVLVLCVLAGVFGLHATVNWRARIREARRPSLETLDKAPQRTDEDIRR